jgi:hypothetical protein
MSVDAASPFARCFATLLLELVTELNRAALRCLRADDRALEIVPGAELAAAWFERHLAESALTSAQELRSLSAGP